MYFKKMPLIVQNLFPDFVWKVSTEKKILYLTFDDGPVPEATPWVLDMLNSYNAKATFFCVGENIVKNFEIYERIIKEGHLVGNHTFNHLNGWATENSTYYNNILQCESIIDNSILFRPPYGKIKPKQAKHLNRSHQVIMWDILSGDFDPKLSNKDCLKNVISNVDKGSIVVFHDSIKALTRLQYTLPKVLDHYSKLGYVFDNLSVVNATKK